MRLGRRLGQGSMFGFGSVPIDTDDARAFIQRRIALCMLVSGSISGAFFVLDVARVLITQGSRVLAYATNVSTVAHFATTLFILALWLYCRKGARSEFLLHKVDAAGTCVMCAGLTVLGWGMPIHLRPEFTVALAVMLTLVNRSALVPSTGWRTAGIATMAVLPSVASTYLLYARAAAPDLPSPLTAAFFCAQWNAAAVALSCVVSSVVYGLQRRMEEVVRLGQYTLEEQIGEGGMGVVYKARHALLRRPTAIKLLPAGKAGEQRLARFEREVQLTSKLTHPNTIAVYDFGRTPDGTFYYAMEYLEGLDLETLVEQHGPLPASRAVHILLQACGAISEAHRLGLIHRDIKPANIFLCERGGIPDFVKVLDFGLVKSVDDGGGAMLTREGTLTGTPLYMAPEAITDPEVVDGRVDIYALGAVGYFLITGRHVFEGKTLVQVCSAHLHTQPIPPSERLGRPVPARLEALLLRCLAKDPEARPADARALADALRACADVPVWSEQEAGAWWSKRATGQAIIHRPTTSTATTQVNPLRTTVAIDFASRAADA